MYNDNNNTGWSWNPPRQNVSPFSPLPPHYAIIEVNGEAGAKSFRMAPNSSQFLADISNPKIIWAVQTDGAGYLTATPLDVNIHQNQPAPDLNNLETRIKQLEDTLNEYVNSRSNKQPSPKKHPSGNAAATNGNSAATQESN